MSVRTISGMQLATTIYVALPVSSRFITCVAARIDAKDQTYVLFLSLDNEHPSTPT